VGHLGQERSHRGSRGAARSACPGCGSINPLLSGFHFPMVAPRSGQDDTMITTGVLKNLRPAYEILAKSAGPPGGLSGRWPASSLTPFTMCAPRNCWPGRAIRPLRFAATGSTVAYLGWMKLLQKDDTNEDSTDTPKNPVPVLEPRQILSVLQASCPRSWC